MTVERQIILGASDAVIDDFFGNSVAVSNDTLVVGAYRASTSAGAGAGAAYVYVRSGENWSQQAKLIASDGAADDTFGHSVAIDGDTIVVGAPLAAAGGKNDAGAAYVYVRTGTTWSQQAKLVAADPQLGVKFGTSVAVSGDTAAAGAPFVAGSDPYQGAVYVFSRSGTSWTQQSKLVNGAMNDNEFGSALALNTDTMVIGARDYDRGAISTGAAYVYKRSGSTWSFVIQLLASDRQTGDNFGNAVALSPNKNFVVIGAHHKDTVWGTDAGAAYVYEYNGSTWLQKAVLVPPAGRAYNLFGAAVAINDSEILVGSPSFDADFGAVFQFQRVNGNWSPNGKMVAKQSALGDKIGSALALNNQKRVIGALGKNSRKGAAYTTVAGPASPLNSSSDLCSVAASDYRMVFSSNPIALRDGNKQEEAVDLTLKTAAGALDFTRTYLQNKQSTYQSMGLGWTHNHNISLTKIVGTPNQIVIQWSNGGEAGYTESTPNHYDGFPGVPSKVDWNPATSQYALTATDKSVLTFDSLGRLVARTWPSGESWSYVYVSGRLTEVSDGYGRKLTFRYFTSGSFNGQLFRVGDQTFDDANPTAPTGRYVEYGYVLNRVVDNSGNIVSGTSALLSSVRDSRGNTWQYEYYGQTAAESDIRQLNFLIRRLSPSVDTTGDGIADSPLILEQVLYTMQGTELAVNGGMEVDANWTSIVGAAPTTNQRSNVKVDSGAYSRRVVAGAGSQGIEGNAWDLVAGHTFIVTARVFAVSGAVKMQVSGETAFDRLSSGTGAWQTLRSVYKPTAGATGRKLQFLSNGGPAEFYVDTVSIIDSDLTISAITQDRGNSALSTLFSFQPSGQNRTDETTAGKVTQHLFDNGVYAGSADPQFNVQAKYLSSQYRPLSAVDAKGNESTLSWSSDGRLLESVSDALNRQTTFTYNGSGSSVDTLKDSTDPQGRKTVYTYGDSLNPRLPTDIQVLDVNGTTVLRRQKFSYDNKGRAIAEQVVDPANGTTVLQQTTRSYHTSGNGNGLLHVLTQDDIGGTNDLTTTYSYDTAGRANKVQRSSNFGSCDISFTVYDQAGNTVASICNYDPGLGADPKTAAEAVALFNPASPDKNRVTTYEYDAAGRRVKVTTDAGASYALATITVYDGLDRVIRTITNYVANVAVPNPYTAAFSAFQHGPDNNQNLVSDTAFNQRGMVRKQTDVLGNVTLFAYDDAGRVVKTIQSASQPNYNNDYNGQSPDPTLAGYVGNASADQDLITTNVFDAVGNLVKTTDAMGRTHITLYDVLNRPYKTIRNASQPNYDVLTDSTLSIPAASGGYAFSTDVDKDLVDETYYDTMGRVVRTKDSLGNWTLNGYDSLGRQIRTVRSASSPAYDVTADPALSAYPINAAADLDLVTDTVYDPQGRVMYTVDLNGEKSWTAYDGLGRQVRTVSNAVGTATNGGTSDPRSNSYVENSAADRDLITRTTYDLNGRVQWTQDALGRKTWFVYDAQGRQKKVIRNCTYVSGTPAPEDDAYVGQHAADTAKDVTARTTYDAQGRVFSTIDSRNNETRYEYDVLGRRTKVVTNYVDGVFNPLVPDEDIIETTTYDLAGREVKRVDNAGNETRFVYDLTGRRTKTIVNYQDGVYSPAQPDRDLISTTTFNKGGQPISTSDPRGTQTLFTYDNAGRRQTVTQAAGTPLASTNYTCYDKAGRVLRTIRNYVVDPLLPSPDLKDGSGNFLFAPTTHGQADDQNLVTTVTLDKVGRQTALLDALGNQTTTTYRKDGQILAQADAEGTVTVHRYDRAGRRTTIVQGYAANGEDPSLWVWDSVQLRWETSANVAITFGGNNDQNAIVRMSYDKGGRQLDQRDPRGYQTAYSYDLLDRRLTLTNPLSKQWGTTYADTAGGTSRVILTDPKNTQAQRDFDRLGRLKTVQYVAESPKYTPDIAFAYDAAGNRTKMSEYTGANFTGRVRETTFTYDAAQRLVSAGFDNDGNGVVDETVGYAYDAGGLRTTLTLPGGLTITYSYDAGGRLQSLTDWNSQTTSLVYDAAGRMRAVQRANGLRSQYKLDAGGNLRQLRHMSGSKVLGEFSYISDKRGNRTQAVEMLSRAGAGTTTLDKDHAAVEVVRGTWTAVGAFKQTSNVTAALRIGFCGDQATLTMGTGPDHSLYDIYVDNSYWDSIDGYASAAGEAAVLIALTDDGGHVLEIRNRIDRNGASSGQLMRFKTLVANRVYDYQTWSYTYDALARVRSASQYAGLNLTSTALRAYTYGFDPAGNHLTESLSLNGAAPTVKTYTYNAANQISSAGFSYDSNGNLLTDGTNTYTWDRANRLLSMGGSAYAYDGMGNRVKQTIGAATTQYLLDLQPGLAVVLAQTAGAATDRFVHGPMGLHAQLDAAGSWEWPLMDGLGSVRAVASSTNAVLETRTYDPYGQPLSSTGTPQTPFGFTGEQTDANGLLYLRARHYAPAIGAFTARDPYEGAASRPMSLNGYAWVEGNVVNAVDPSGLTCTLSSYNELRNLAPQILAMAREWNHIPLSDCWELSTPRELSGSGCLQQQSSPVCRTGFSDEAFAYLMAAILHQEGMLRGGIESGIAQLREWAGILANEYGNQNASVGIAQFRQSGFHEIIEGRIPVPNAEPIGFDTLRLNSVTNSYAQHIFLFSADPLPFGQPIPQYAVDTSFLQGNEVSLELLAANIYRGILRATSGRLPGVNSATVFNLAAWHNEGIQGGNRNPYNQKATNYANAVVQHMVEFIEGDCDLGFGRSPVPWSDFLYYNSADEVYLDANWNGTHANVSWR